MVSRKWFGSFSADQRGATANIFAISSLAICGMVGLSLDLGRWAMARQTLQTSLDAGVIAMATARQTGAGAGLEKLTAHVEQNWKRPHGAAVPSLTFAEPAPSAIEATAVSRLDTYFVRILGLDKIDVTASTYGRYGLMNSEVALALDVTGSMAGAKLDSLKTVAKKMIEDVYTVSGAATKVKFSVVPFGQYVNVGLQYRTAPWLSVPPDGTQNVCYKTRPVLAKSGCSTSRVAVTREGEPTSYQDAETCQSYTYGPEVDTCSPVNNTWSGCVGSRTAPLNKIVMADAANPVLGIPNVSCSSPLTRLTFSKSDQLLAIDALSAVGETYVPSGLMWGWRALAPDTPFEDGAIRGGGTPSRKVLVLMTDGENTRSQSGNNHTGGDKAAANALSKDVCTAIKADSVEIYTIAFEVTDAVTLDMLKACASSTENFFDASDATRLQSAFSTIGNSLTIARLVK